MRIACPVGSPRGVFRRIGKEFINGLARAWAGIKPIVVKDDNAARNLGIIGQTVLTGIVAIDKRDSGDANCTRDKMQQRISAVTQEQADALPWWHSIELGNGVVTKGEKSLAVIRAEADAVFRYNVAGKTVLDIGAWDGAFSFEAERRGAADVTALDYYVWTRPEFNRKRCFEFARAALASRVQDVTRDVYAIDPAIGQFDVVLLMGVFYHLENPLLAMRRIAPLAREMLILESHVELNDVDVPAMQFYPNDELGGDATNWWAPNVRCLQDMVGVVGFPRHEAIPNPASPENRVIIHAWRG